MLGVEDGWCRGRLWTRVVREERGAVTLQQEFHNKGRLEWSAGRKVYSERDLTDELGRGGGVFSERG
jgi:hypothetical protein